MRQIGERKCEIEYGTRIKDGTAVLLGCHTCLGDNAFFGYLYKESHALYTPWNFRC